MTVLADFGPQGSPRTPPAVRPRRARIAMRIQGAPRVTARPLTGKRRSAHRQLPGRAWCWEGRKRQCAASSSASKFNPRIPTHFSISAKPPTCAL